MSAFAGLTLKNNAGTDVVFSPLTIDSNGVASYATAEPVFDAKSFVSISSRVPSSKVPKARWRLKVTVPIMNPLNTSEKLDEFIGTVELAIPRNMDSTLRLNGRKYVETLIANAVTTAFATSFEGIY